MFAFRRGYQNASVCTVDRQACNKVLSQVFGRLFVNRCGIPGFDRSHVGRRDQIPAVVGNRHAINHALMSKSRDNQRINLRPIDRHKLPFSNSAVGSSSQNKSIIRSKDHRILFGLWLAERIETFSSSHIPDFDRRVGTCRSQQLSIRTKAKVKHRAVVAGHFSDLLTSFRIVQNDATIVSGRCDNCSVRRPVGRIKNIVVAGELLLN